MAQSKAVQKALKELLSVIDPAAIVRTDKQRKLVYIGDEVATDAQLQNLKAEAQFLRESELWKIMYHTPKQLAQEAMFVDGETLADMQKGRTMLFTLEAQKNIVETFATYGDAKK